MRTATLARLCGGAVAVLAATAAALPGQALGAGGATTLSFAGPATRALRAQGVRVAPLTPAHGGSGRVTLPIAAGLAGAETSLLRLRGGFALVAADGRRAPLTKLSLLLGKRSRLTANLAGSKVELLTVAGGRRQVDPLAGTIKLSGLRLRLTAGAARAIAQRLGIDPLPSGRIGSLAAVASGLTAAGAAPGSGGSGSPTGGAPQAARCQQPSGPGPAAESSPPLPVRPPTASEVTSASLAWRVRESFVRYIATGEGTSASAGATADPPELTPESSLPLSYRFHFPFASGWHDGGADPTSPADDDAALYFSGALRFHYSAHGIDLTAADPEIELDGAASRAIFTISEAGGAGERQVLVNLDLSRAGAISHSGNSYAYERVPGAVPAGTATSVFAGFYTPGTEFGCFDIAFSTGS